MIMKNMKHLLLVSFGFGLFANTTLASEPSSPIRINQENFQKLNSADQQCVLQIVDRLETISTIDRSTLTHEERKALRTEVRDLKREAATYNRGGEVIYISAGTVIIILLLILLLR